MKLIRYESISIDIPKLQEYHRTDHHWLYFASFSPIWGERIIEYNGTINHDTFRVDFLDDDDLEEFYQEYGYEPDEQDRSVCEKIMHNNVESQLTMKGFCCMFNKTKTVRVKKQGTHGSILNQEQFIS